ncbi:MAG: hotdog domain-containing protein [Thermoanaerobaculia bacterium]
MSDRTMEAGATGEATMAVDRSDTAEALSLSADDTFPPVFATSRMIALMELAAARAMKPLLDEGELSVGVTVDIRHVAPTPIGATATARATYLGPDGKLFRFRVEAFDDAGPIGDGEHVRAIVTTERLMTGASRRLSRT